MTEQERIIQTVLDYFEGWSDDVDRWCADVHRMARTLAPARSHRDNPGMAAREREAA